MNFFLTLLVIVIVFNLLYYTTKELIKGFPSLVVWFFVKIATLWLYLRGIVYRLRRVREEEVVEGGTKELRRWPPPYLVRRYAHQWMKKLENDQGWAWRLYVAKVPAYYRECSPDYAYSLPLWIEQTSSTVARLSVQLFAIYILASLLMPHLAYFNMTAIEATQAKLYSHLGIEVASCLSNNEGVCFLMPHEESLGVEKLLEMTRHHYHPPNSPTNKTTLDLLVGDREQVLYPLAFSGGVVQYVSIENELIPLLMHWDKEEREATGTTKQPCICPVFLNMPGNLSFLYDTSQQEWLVMLRPTIYRNNSFAELVSSTITYNRQSLFFSQHHRVEELIHYDSFVVEYMDPVSPPQPKSVKNLSDTLREVAFEEASLFTKISSLNTKQMHISGEDAVCFVYCNTKITCI